jgi:type I site-specific restriction endonuclease
MDPTAQGTQAEGNVSDQQSNQNQPQGNQNSGLQERIDQLTAFGRRWEQQANEFQNTIAQQQATIAQLLQGQNQRAVPPEPQVEIDPEDAKKIAHIVKLATAPLQAQIQQLTGAVMQTRYTPQMESVAEKLKRINNPQVTDQVNRLLSQWKGAGLLDNGTYSPEDALNVVVGKMVTGQMIQGAENQTTRQQFNGSFQPFALPNGNGTRPQGNMPALQVPAKKEKDLTEMDADELTAVLNDINKRNPDGFTF